MGRGLIFRIFTYFLGVSFFLLTGGFPEILAEEKGKNLPIGEMVSRGEVKFEAKGKIWKKVEPSYFPIFQGSKIKTEKGSALISLINDNQMEMGPNTILLFDRRDQIRLLQGTVNFRIGSPEGISIKVGKLTVANTPPLQAASRGMLVPQANVAAIGTIFVHSNGSVTIQSAQGQFTILNQQRVALAALSSKESLRIPSPIMENPPTEKAQEILLAQVGEVTPSEEKETETEKFLGISQWTWAAIGLGALAVVGIGAAAGGGGGGGGGGGTPICR